MPLTVAITGANTGVGRALAEHLAARGDRVILACRSRARAEDALRSIEGARFVPLDLADLASVRRAAEALAAIRIDVLVNNAGVAGARGVTRDGFELAFGVNHLGHYLLTRLVPFARVVHLGSGSHERADGLDLAALRAPTRSLTGLDEYATSKLCVMLFHRALLARGVRSSVADPGDVASDAWRHLPWPLRPLLTCRMPPPAVGARTPFLCATGALPDGGLYCGGAPRPASAVAGDLALAERLHLASAGWVGLPPEPIVARRPQGRSRR